ncbi:Threonine--tRNA ligase [Pseudobythopirellula maris]|uniref:Threonine--tRNA ligase n=1 Tax=Pseudobythopirellula maris TaxID=2527991 RepID=A0A5C5ZN99_9BACT|nr:threonine--tRNA ligase [Pseudobythopirellula maris]TWT88650.1 Threonine--tRNA ligase [Pseudobythopirellula maris]
MLTVKLPDGNQKTFDQPVTCLEIAEAIGPGLAKAAIAAEVDGVARDLSHQLAAEGEAAVRFLTKRDDEALAIMRHSCAHVMAQAVMRLHPGVQLAFGPTTGAGFYYDMRLKEPISEDDFPKIEAEMARIVKENLAFERLEKPKADAIALCEELEQQFKVEHLGTGLGDEEEVSFYRQGEFIDLCRGVHVPTTASIGKGFKLLSIAGAYWKGDAKREQLQRLYATAFFDKKELKAHLAQIEEAKKRDHRTLGRQHELFAIDQKVGSGLILWLPKGAVIRQTLEDYLKVELRRRGYEAVYTPNVGRVELYETSGHFPYYRESQFPVLCEHEAGQLIDALVDRLREGGEASLTDQEEAQLIAAAKTLGFDGDYDPAASAEERAAALDHWAHQHERYLLKPMNCPHHIMIYQSKPRSYRELPVRLAEFGTVYRYEQSGELSGMTRVRGFCQDDAHIFCTPDQVADEFRACLEMTQGVLQSLGMDNYRVRLGFRDPDGTKYVGGAEVWDKAEAELKAVCDSMDLPDVSIEPGEAAFYGPKADFVVTDCIGREWQLGTVQLDYNLPSESRFALEYTGRDNQPHRPVMIHRAPLGSMERFIGVLIEHFAAAFPLWLAPEQVRVLTVSEKSEEYGREVLARLKAEGLRAEGDFKGSKLGAKIREGQLELIPYMLVVGEKDRDEGTVTVRDRIEGDLGASPLDEAIAKLQAEIADKTVRQVAEGATVDLGGKAEANEY